MRDNLSKEKGSGARSRREAGVLLPVTSLPSKYGIGDLGIDIY